MKNYFLELGGELHVNTLVTDFKIENRKVVEVIAQDKAFVGDYFICAYSAVSHGHFPSFSYFINKTVSAKCILMDILLLFKIEVNCTIIRKRLQDRYMSKFMLITEVKLRFFQTKKVPFRSSLQFSTFFQIIQRSQHHRSGQAVQLLPRFPPQGMCLHRGFSESYPYPRSVPRSRCLR